MAITVTGTVAGADLGIVAVHEYLMRGLPGWDQDPFVRPGRLAGFATLLASLRRFKELGGGTVVEVGGSASGRDPDTLERLAIESGVNIIASTGFAGEQTWPPHFSGQSWRPGRDDLVALMEGELRSGLALPGMLRNSGRAGVVVVGAAEEAGPSPAEEETIRAAALAARRADVPIVAPARHGQDVVKLLTAEGIAPDRIVLSHCDDPRLSDSDGLADLGTYLSYDHIGWENGSAAHAMPDAQRIALIKSGIEAGRLERIVLSCSALGVGLGLPASTHSLVHLLETFVPNLRQAGIGHSEIDTMLIENPARLFAAGGAT